MNVTERTGKVVNVRQVGSDDTVVLITDHGQVIRLAAKQVRITGRNAQGVHLVKLEEGEKVRAVARLAEGTEEKKGPMATAPMTPVATRRSRRCPRWTHTRGAS
jgi:DNA gyrase subunit A